jgi:ribosomal protein L35
MQSHNLGKKTAKRKRAFSRELEVAQPDRSVLRKLLGGGR